MHSLAMAVVFQGHMAHDAAPRGAIMPGGQARHDCGIVMIIITGLGFIFFE
jgi:hypothetical protein